MKDLPTSTTPRQQYWHDESEYEWDFAYHLFKGLEYKYPICCIIWFVHSYQRLNMMHGFNIEDFPNTHGKRIACPDCMINTVSFGEL